MERKRVFLLPVKMTTDVRSDPIEPPKRVREMSSQTVRALIPMPTTDAATTPAATTPAATNPEKELTEIRQQMSKVKGKLRKLANNRPDWPSLSSSVALLGARQELILAKLDTIRNRQKDNDGLDSNTHDGCIDSDDDDLWDPITPEEENPCYEGATLCQCRQKEL